MSTGRIMALLEHHLGTWAAKKGVPVASQNVQFSDTGSLYLQSYLLPATTECLDLAQVSRVYHGVYQMTLVSRRVAARLRYRLSLMISSICLIWVLF